jgi:hypothetical protein
MARDGFTDQEAMKAGLMDAANVPAAKFSKTDPKYPKKRKPINRKKKHTIPRTGPQ